MPHSDQFKQNAHSWKYNAQLRLFRKIRFCETNIFKIALYGCIFLSFFGLLLNYFINLSKAINIIILISFLIYLISSLQVGYNFA